MFVKGPYNWPSSNLSRSKSICSHTANGLHSCFSYIGNFGIITLLNPNNAGHSYEIARSGLFNIYLNALHNILSDFSFKNFNKLADIPELPVLFPMCKCLMRFYIFSSSITISLSQCILPFSACSLVRGCPSQLYTIVGLYTNPVLYGYF